jgi:hypothetical protein
MNKDTDKERKFIERLQVEAPDLLGGKVDFKALFGNIMFSNGNCIRFGRQPDRLFAKPKKRRRKV